MPLHVDQGIFKMDVHMSKQIHQYLAESENFRDAWAEDEFDQAKHIASDMFPNTENIYTEAEIAWQSLTTQMRQAFLDTL